LDLGEFPRTAEHLQRCVELDPKYSAVWKLLGKAHLGQGDLPAARAHGDKQAEKEVTVFLKKLDRHP